MKTCPECKGDGYTAALGQEREYCQHCDAVGALRVPTKATDIPPGPGRIAVYAARYRAGKRIFNKRDVNPTLS